METQVTSSRAQTKPGPGPRRWFMLAPLLGATMMAAIDIFIVNVAVPSIKYQLHTGFAEIQLISASYSLAYAALLITGGRLGDLYGRKRIFLLGVGGFTLFSALCGLAPNALLLIIFRIAQGATAALMTPQVISFIQVSFISRERAAAMSAYGATLGLASILGLIVGGGLLAANLLNMGWRSIFLINVPLGLLVLITTGLMVSESKEPEARSLDYGGVVLLTLALSLFIFSLVLGGNTGWPLWTRLCLIVSLPCIIAFWTYERRLTKQGKTPLISPFLFHSRLFAIGNLINLLNGILWNGMIFLFSLYLQTILHLVPLQAGLAMTVGSISFVIASGASTSLIGYFKHRTFSIAAGMITLGNLLVLLSADFLAARWGVFPVLVAFFVLAFGQALLYAPLMPKTLEEIDLAYVGTASGIYAMIIETSATLGVTIIGIIYALLIISNSSSVSFVLTVLLVTVFSLVTIFLVQLLRSHSSSTKSTSR